MSALVSCDSTGTQKYVAAAKASNNPNYVVAGYWLELLSYADMGDSVKVEHLMPDVVAADWDTANEERAKTSLRQLQTELEGLRVAYKLPATCNG